MKVNDIREKMEKEPSCLPTCSSLSYIGNIDYVTENGRSISYALNFIEVIRISLKV